MEDLGWWTGVSIRGGERVFLDGAIWSFGVPVVKHRYVRSVFEVSSGTMGNPEIVETSESLVKIEGGSVFGLWGECVDRYAM